MNIFVKLMLIFEAVFALWLLYRGGILKDRALIAECIALTALAFLLRSSVMSYETLDYQNFLTQWVDFFRKHGGFKALSHSIGNYNLPYLYFLAGFSYMETRDLYLIKLLSTFFDVVLAWSSMKLVGRFSRSPRLRMVCFFTVLLWPTVFLNGALWGQCDSVYTAMALLGIYLALEDRPCLSMICIAVSFGFKLQAIFIMPVYAVLWMYGKFSWKHFLLFPASYIVLVLPAVIAGRPFLDTLMLYYYQADGATGGLNYNSPSVYAIFDRAENTPAAGWIGVIAAFVFILAVLAVCLKYRKKLNDKAVLAAAVLFAVGIPFFLPYMHDRYFFPADILTLTAAFALPPFLAGALLTEFASLLGYHAYLKMRYLLPMSYGSAALIIVLSMAVVLFISGLSGADRGGEGALGEIVRKNADPTAQ